MRWGATTGVEEKYDLSVTSIGVDRDDRMLWLSVLKDDGRVVAVDSNLRTLRATSPEVAMTTLIGFLSAWADAVEYGPDSENVDLFGKEWGVILPHIPELELSLELGEVFSFGLREEEV